MWEDGAEGDGEQDWGVSVSRGHIEDEDGGDDDDDEPEERRVRLLLFDGNCYRCH